MWSMQESTTAACLAGGGGRRREDGVERAVLVLLQQRAVLAQHRAAPEPAVQACLWLEWQAWSTKPPDLCMCAVQAATTPGQFLLDAAGMVQQGIICTGLACSGSCSVGPSGGPRADCKFLEQHATAFWGMQHC